MIKYTKTFVPSKPYVNERFTLLPYTIDLLRDMEPEFGYEGYGELVFYRTYSRYMNGHQENWADCVIRVIEGVMSIRKDWYAKNYISWDERWWQSYARKIAIAMFRMHWMPPGRGLWAMGTDFVYQRGGMALINCSATSILDDPAEDYEWMMDSLMLGVGVGFSPDRDDTLRFKSQRGIEEIVITDDREGWANSVYLQIKSHHEGTPRIRFIYDEIRPSGVPIKAFGGLASGPEPLITLHEKIDELIDQYMTDRYYDSVILKTDISNLIGCCVCAGNLRRSAEKANLSVKDPIFKNLKDYEKYPDRAAWGWMSNNSVDLEDEEDYDQLGDIAQRIIVRGEPGYNNLKNYPLGRIGKKDNVKKDRARNSNPCLTGETKLLTADGRGYLPIKELVGQDLDVYCVNDEDEIVIRRMRNVHLTQENVKIIKVTFDDGKSIRVSETHRFMIRDCELVEARHLQPGTSMVVLNRYTPLKENSQSYFDRYISLGYKANNFPEHRTIGEHKFGEIHGYHIHHKDENRFNNNPDNLELRTQFDHLSEHGEGENNGNHSGLSHEQLIELGVTLCLKLGRRFSCKEWQELGNGVKFFSKYRKEEFKSILEFSYFCADQAGFTNYHHDPRTLRHLEEMIHFGYEAEIINGTVNVKKECEVCGKEFWINSQDRNIASCSKKCNLIRKRMTVDQEDKRKSFAEIKKNLQDYQLSLYREYCFYMKEEPTREEWERYCEKNRTSSDLKYTLKDWETLKERAKDHNHKIVSVTEDGYEDVYNGSVDEFHNFFVGGFTRINSYNKKIEVGILNANCSEILLETAYDVDGKNRVRETCNVDETCPTRCENNEQWLEACEYATFYASTVSLLPTHQPSTNRVVFANRRIGVSVVDVSGWKETEGVNKVTKYLRKGYKRVRETNRRFNGEAGVPESIRVTTIKPGGTIPKLVGRTPGAGYPTFKETMRRTRIAKNSPIAAFLIEQGLYCEPDVNDNYTLVFDYPILQGPAPPATEVSLWQSAMDVVWLQREWADNAVSNTLYFKPMWELRHVFTEEQTLLSYLQDRLLEYDDYIFFTAKMKNGFEEILVKDYKIIITYDDDIYFLRANLYRFNPHHEERSIEPVLSTICPLTKSVSLLPHSAKGVYAQMPEIGLTEEEYEYQIKKLPKIDWTKYKGGTDGDADADKYCSGSSCDPNQGK